MHSVVTDVSRNFILPKSAIAGRHPEMGAVMAVPETAVDENDRPILTQNQIRLAGKGFAVDTEPDALFEKGFANEDFRICVLPPDPGHHPASGGRINNINQCG